VSARGDEALSIVGLLNEIANDEIVLPAIQRDFVWDEEQTEKLLDSILRGYPVGLVLLWETYEDLQYRTFLRDFRPGQLYAYRDNSRRRRVKLVLDGQQRLQSLYIALFGTREGKRLYLDVLSGESSDDVAEERYHFYFLTSEEAEEWNDASLQEAEDEERDLAAIPWLAPVGDLFRLGAKEKKDFVRDLTAKLRLPDDMSLRVDVNLAIFDEVLTKDEDILRVSTIDSGLPAESPNRKTEADVLEVFVRINREGTPLSRSDLIFSMLKLNWKESAEALPEFVASINEGNSLAIDADFVIRSLFVVSDLGSRLDLNLLRKRSNVQALQSNFSECREAIRSVVDFVVSEARCQSSSLLGGVNTLVPFVYYTFRAKRHEIPNSQVDNVRTALYLFAFARPFSRYADSRIGAFVRNELKALFDQGDHNFSVSDAIYWVRYWEGIESLAQLAQRNESLALHLVQGLTGAKFQYHLNAPEIDHIFPRAQLRRREYSEDQINNFANFWILAKGKNRNKSDKHPKQYFADVSDTQLGRALIPREMLDYRRFTTFLDTRKSAIVRRLGRTLQLTDSDLSA
jgi:hypothetical protein